MHQTNPQLGISLIIAAMMLNAIKDGMAKLLSAGYTPLTILLIQFIVTSTVLAPLVIYRIGPGALIPNQILAQLFRSLFVTVGVGLYYWAVSFIPIADATAMLFIAPLIVTAMSPLVLGEPLGLRRTIAVIIGFVGVLIILRPTMEGDRTGYFIALAAGIFLSAFYMANRKLAGAAPIMASAYYTSFLGAVLLLPFLALYWTTPNVEDLALFAGFSIIATMGQILLVAAFSFAGASIISPFVYTQVVGATIVGYVLFGTLPDQMSWVGIAIVASAGVYIAIREIKLKER